MLAASNFDLNFITIKPKTGFNRYLQGKSILFYLEIIELQDIN